MVGLSIPKDGNSQPIDSVGARIAQARRRKGVAEWREIGRSDMARELELSPETIRTWEDNKKRPRKEALPKLATYLGVTEWWILYGVDVPAASPGFVSVPPSADIGGAEEEG